MQLFNVYHLKFDYAIHHIFFLGQLFILTQINCQILLAEGVKKG